MQTISLPHSESVFRLCLKLKVGSLLAVFERLQIVGQCPVTMRFDREPEATLAVLFLDFTRVNESTAVQLAGWFRGLVGVHLVCAGYIDRSSSSLEHSRREASLDVICGPSQLANS